MNISVCIYIYEFKCILSEFLRQIQVIPTTFFFDCVAVDKINVWAPIVKGCIHMFVVVGTCNFLFENNRGVI